MAGQRSYAHSPLKLEVCALAAALLLSAVAYCQSPIPPAAQALPNRATLPGASVGIEEQEVVDVRIVGNSAIPTAKVLQNIGTRKGRPFDQPTFEKDVRKLATKGWFLDVKTRREQVPGGIEIIFEVVERPTLQYVKYVGNKRIKSSKLAKETGLKKGDPMDPYAVDEGRRKIEALYQEKGFNSARVTVFEGTKTGDRGATYLIHEGASEKVWSIKFKGNTIASEGRLKTQIESKTPILLIFKGQVDRKRIDGDVERLTAYYRSLGFFRARVGRELDYNEKQDWLTLTFVIYEGPRYAIRNVSVVGNSKFAAPDLTKDLRLKAGEFYDQTKMNSDVGTLRDQYGDVGYIFANIQAEPRFLEEPGQLDLVYNISEGDRYRIGEIKVQVEGESPHTRHAVLLNRLGFRPGDIASTRVMREAERRLKASGLFQVADPSKAPKIVFSPPDEDNEKVIGKRTGNPNTFRGQSPDDVLVPVQPIVPAPRRQLPESRSEQPAGQKWIIRGQSPDLAWRSPPSRPAAVPASEPYDHPLGPAPRAGQPATRAVFRGQSPGAIRPVQYTDYGGRPLNPIGPESQPRAAAPGAAPIYEAVPPATGPNGPAFLSGDPLLGPGPVIPADPALTSPDKIIDPRIVVQETQTGRFMFGVGVNSDAGVIGNIVIDEQNFDWRRWPSSWEDFRNGTAFRGAGQRFRIEAAPGTQVQRYLASFQEPYLFDTPVSFGLSGFYYTRIFKDWTEGRLGGRGSLGYQFTPDLSGNISLGAQQVNIKNPHVPTPPELAEVLGKTQLYSVKATLAHDTRDNTFLATQGHYIELDAEYNFGSFQFPRSNVDMRKFFMLHERPDGSGRHVLTLSGRLGVSGQDTPIYEHYFAGGFSSLRGFQFRGASPVSGGVQVGGEFQAIGSVEYMFPITADDMLRAVTFIDFGAVEAVAKFEPNTFRAAPGVGLRITVPALGPAPIALDFAFPVAQADTDVRQVFSFFVGFGR